MTMSASDPRPNNRRLTDFVIRLGHYAHLVLVAGVAVAIPLGAAQLFTHGTVKSVLDNIDTVVSAAIVVAISCSWIHERQVCLLDVAEAPLTNPDEAVKQNMRKLRAVHDVRTFLTMLGIVVGFTVTSLIASLIYPSIKPSIWFKAINKSLVDLLMIYIAWRFFAVTIHSRLQPWCPFCRWGRGDDGDGGDGDPEPGPPDPEARIKDGQYIKLGVRQA